MSNERTEGVLCLVGADTPEALKEELTRISHFIACSVGLRLIDVVYTATKAAHGKRCVTGMWVASLDEMQHRIRFAIHALECGRSRLRDKSGVFFTTSPLALSGGKLAFVFPGTGSFHLEMMRDLALTFDGVRQRFDDMEEAFSGFCDVASPSEWLFSTSPEHTLPLDPFKSFLPLLATASTYLASKVFADLLDSVGVVPDAVGGVGLGSFTAFHATHHDPKRRLVKILRDAGRILMRLGQEGARTPMVQLTASGIPTASLQQLAKRDPQHIVISQILSDEDTVLAVAPERQAEVETAIRNGGGLSVAEPLLAPFNTGLAPAAIRRIFEDFFAGKVTSASHVPFYSCCAGETELIGPEIPDIVRGLTDQMIRPLDFRAMIGRMYDDGCRIFVEVGARGLLTPLIEKILKDRPEPVAVIPMHILHRSGGMQVGQALGRLAAQGVSLDYSGLRFFDHAKRLNFDCPVADSQISLLTLKLPRELPVLKPDQIDPTPYSVEVPVTAQPADHQCAIRRDAPNTGTPFPLLARGCEERFRSDSELHLRCVMRIEDVPYFNDYAIGTTLVSLTNPQLRGLTLFSVSSALELMAEAAKRLVPGLLLIRIDHLRAQHWLSFEFGALPLRVIVQAGTPEADGSRRIRARLTNDSDEQAQTAMEAQFVFGTGLPRAPEPEDVPLAAPKPVGWRAKDIYPSRLFQGPLLRNVRLVQTWGYNGIDYEIRMPARSATVRYVRDPRFEAMPLLLDAALSGFQLWRSHERFHGAISLPFRCTAIHYYAAWIREGTRLKATLRLVNVTTRSHQVDIIVSDQAGNTILEIRGWEEVSGRAGRELHNFIMNPARYFITQPLPAAILPSPDAEIIGSIYVNDTPDFFVGNQELWLRALAEAVLTPNEREDFAQMGGAPLRRLEWLLGRTAAKEAVRRALLANYDLCTASADIAIWKDNLGKPHPLGDWQNRISAPLDLTIAHTEGLILGAVTAKGRLGLDVESVGRDLTEDFLRGVFTLEEQELATRAGDGPTAILRFWCSKEAISKALGTGIRFAPTDLRIRSSDPATGMLEMELLGAWADNFPALRDRRIPIKTTVLYDHVIAACLLPHL